MKELKELIYILSLNKTKQIRKYGFLQDETGRLMTFYKGLLKGEWKADEEAAQEILGVAPKHKTYRRLKNTLKEELLNAILFLDLDNGDYSDLQKAYSASHKKWMQISNLRMHFAKNVSKSLAKSSLKTAIKYDFTSLIIDLSRQLRITNAAYFGDEKEHQYYTDLIKKYSDILLLEIQTETIFTSITKHYVKSKAKQNKLFDLYINDYQNLEPFFGKVDSYIFHSYGYLIGVNLYLSINDFETTTKICRKGIEYFENKPYNHRTGKLVFLYQLTVCSIQLENYEETRATIEKCYSLTKRGKHHWFRTIENHILLCLHTNKYEQAWELFKTAKKSKGFQHLLAVVKERWVLHEAYIQFLIEIGKAGKDVRRDKKFQISKFLNEVPTFSQDKRGLNIPILIIQVLFLLARNKYDKASLRIESLSKYNNRYLKKGANFRTSCFIKMLIISANQGFQPHATALKAKPILDKLTEHKTVFANQSAEIEYIPYHYLWEHYLTVLKKGNRRQVAKMS